MNRWTPEYSHNINESDLRIFSRVRRWMPRQRLTRTDLVLILTNGAWHRRGRFIFYTLHDPFLPPSRRDIGLAAGLDDVTVVVEPRHGRIVAVTRRWRLPRLRRPRPRGWSPAVRLAAAPANLRLTFHAKERMNQRHLTREDITLVIRHGKCVHREGKVYYTLLGRRERDTKQRSPWQRLDGVIVLVCPYTTRIITVWNAHDNSHRQLRRKPKEGRQLWWPGAAGWSGTSASPATPVYQ